MPPLPASVRGFGRFDAGLVPARPEEIRRRQNEGHIKLEKFLQTVAEAHRVIVSLEEGPVLPKGAWAEWKSVSTQVTNGWEDFAAIGDRLKIQMESLPLEDVDPIPLEKAEVEKILSKNKPVSTKLVEQAVTLLSLHYRGLDEIREISPKLREILFNSEVEPLKARIAELEAREPIAVESQLVSATQQEFRKAETSLQQMLLESFGGEDSLETLRDLIHEWAEYKASIRDLEKQKKDTDKRLTEWKVKHDAKATELNVTTAMLKDTNRDFRRTQDKYAILENSLEAKTKQLSSEISRRKKKDERNQKMMADVMEREEAAKAKVNRVAELQEEAIMSEDRINQLTVSVAEYEAQVPQLGQIINELLAGYSSLVTRHDDLVEKSSVNLKKLDDDLKVKEQARKENDSKWRAALAAKSKELKESEESCSKYEDRLKKLSISYSAQSEKLEETTTRFAAQSEHSKKVEASNAAQSAELEAVKRDVVRKVEELGALKQSISVLQADSLANKTLSGSKDDKIVLLERDVQNKSFEMERRDQKLSDQSTEIWDLKTTLNDTKEDFQRSSATLSSQGKLLEREQATVLRNFEKVNSLTETIQVLRNDISNNTSTISSLTSRVENQASEIRTQTDSIAKLTLDINSKAGEISSSRLEIESKAQDLTNNAEEISNLKSKIQSQVAQLNANATIISSLNTEIDQSSSNHQLQVTEDGAKITARDEEIDKHRAELKSLQTKASILGVSVWIHSAVVLAKERIFNQAELAANNMQHSLESKLGVANQTMNDLKIQVQSLNHSKTVLSEEVVQHTDKALEQSMAIRGHLKTIEGLKNALQLKQDETAMVELTCKKTKDDYKTETDSLRGTILNLQASRTRSISHAAQLLSFITVGKAPEIMSFWIEIAGNLIFDDKPQLVLETSQSWWIVNVPFDASLLCLGVTEHHNILNVILLYLLIAEGKSSDPLASKYVCELSRHISECSAAIVQMAIAVVECYCSTLSTAANSEEESMFALGIIRIFLAIRQRNSILWQVFGIRLEADIHKQLEVYITTGPALVKKLYQVVKFTINEVSSQDEFTKAIWAAVNTAFNSCLDYGDTILATDSTCPYVILIQAQNETVFTLVGKKHFSIDTSIEFMHIGTRYLLTAEDGASLQSLIFQDDRKTHGPNHWWADNIVPYIPAPSSISRLIAEVNGLEECGEFEDLDVMKFDYPGLE